MGFFLGLPRTPLVFKRSLVWIPSPRGSWRRSWRRAGWALDAPVGGRSTLWTLDDLLGRGAFEGLEGLPMSLPPPRDWKLSGIPVPLKLSGHLIRFIIWAPDDLAGGGGRFLTYRPREVVTPAKLSRYDAMSGVSVRQELSDPPPEGGGSGEGGREGVHRG